METEDDDGQGSEDYEEVDNIEFPSKLVLMAQQSDPDLPSLLRWIRTFIVHFLEKRTLEAYVTHFLDDEMSFTIVDVNRS